MPALRRRLLAEAPYLMAALPELPRLLHQRLSAPPATTPDSVHELALAQRARNKWMAVLAVLLAALVVVLLLRPA
jgi:ubiquinone biosynthesis protein